MSFQHYFFVFVPSIAYLEQRDRGAQQLKNDPFPCEFKPAVIRYVS